MEVVFCNLFYCQQNSVYGNTMIPQCVIQLHEHVEEHKCGMFMILVSIGLQPLDC